MRFQGTMWAAAMGVGAVRRVLCGLGLAVLLGLAGCGDGDAPPSEASAVIGTAGGTLNGPDGVQLVISPGALDGPTRISISNDGSGASAIGGLRPISKVFAATPHGTQFAEGTRISLPFDPAEVPAGAQPVVIRSEPGGSWTALASDVSGAMVSADISGFSYYAVGTCFTSRDRLVGGPDPTLACPSAGNLTLRLQDGSGNSLPVPRTPSGTALPAMTVTTATQLQFTVEYNRPPSITRGELLSVQAYGAGLTPAQQPLTAFPIEGFTPATFLQINPATVPGAGRPGGVVVRVKAYVEYTTNAFYLGCLCFKPASWTFEAEVPLRVIYTAPVTSAATLPVISTQPAGQAVVEPAPATFTVAATGSPVPGVQWQVLVNSGATWADISGATSASYTTAATTLANSGAQYRAVFTNTAGAATTGSATLTVQAAASSAFPANAALLRAFDNVNATELWITDGTADGTVLVKDIWPGLSPSTPQEFTRFGPYMYFSARDGTNGYELWRTDGTSAGTTLVIDLIPGASNGFPFNLTICNGSLFFGAEDETGGSFLWKTDGTAAGTVRVASVQLDTGTKPVLCLNNVLFFKGYTPTYGLELWRSDGSTAGTFLLKDIAPGTSNSSPKELTAFLGGLYFNADGGLWKSDGTGAGTVVVASGADPTWLTAVGSTLYFSGQNASGKEPWKSDGTPQGTSMIKDLLVGGPSSFPYKFTVSNGVTFFAAELGGRAQLFRTDGTAAGTVLVRAISPGSVGGFGDSMLDVNGVLYFSADETGTGNELWKSDGTSAGTVLVKAIFPGSGSFPTGFFQLGGVLYFSASAGSPVGTELWKSDGTAAGTVLVKDMCPAADCSGGPSPR